MVDVDDESLCLLCAEPALAGEDCVVTGSFLTRRDPLWRYAGRALHRRCFSVWSRREEFVRKFNAVMRDYASMDAQGNVRESLDGSWRD